MRRSVWITLAIVAAIVVAFLIYRYAIPDTLGPNEETPDETQTGTETENDNPEPKHDGAQRHNSMQHKDYTAKLAPKFSSDELLAPPAANWITHGGNIYNSRYSTLDQIDTSNVGNLKLEWVTSLGSGKEFKYSGESTPIVYDGVMFTITGADDVAAIDAKTGEVIWEYHPELTPELDTVCCGWTSRGVAIGDGKVFVGLLDGYLIALDQKTGELVWETQVAEWEKGYTVTSAPLYWDNKLYIGVAGGEYGIRGFLAAYDAKHGREIWKNYNIPAPGEPGSDTWPDDNDAWMSGGAPIWQIPAIDPELGLLYYSTGNAAPDFDGSMREGDNLYTDSILAIDANTGEYRWHFQEVHHDIWDMDPANPVILFDVEIDGKMRKGIGQAGKTGWLYLLDRTNGEPLIGIEEKPVPQLAQQKTSPTQPFPIGDAFVPQGVTEEDIKRDLPDGYEGKIGDIFTPFWEEPILLKPSPQGGANWPPSAYNPNTELYYIMGNDNYFKFTHDVEEESKFVPGGAYIGSSMQPVEGAPMRGTITAMDVKTNKIVWQEKWDALAYSGLLTTKGNLLFAGHNDGRIIAYDATNGKQLWEFMTDAGANAPPITYEVDGKQYITIFSAGNSLSGSKHGDKIFTFSLEGNYASIDEVPEEKINTTTLAGKTEEQDIEEHQAESDDDEHAVEEAVENGHVVYENNCLACHGAEGVGGHNGPNLQQSKMITDRDALIKQVKEGKGGMPGFENTLTEAEINNVVEYIMSLKK
jgi:quinohemoprotein ethanol dehydrogenase